MVLSACGQAGPQEGGTPPGGDQGIAKAEENKGTVQESGDQVTVEQGPVGQEPAEQALSDRELAAKIKTNIDQTCVYPWRYTYKCGCSYMTERQTLVSGNVATVCGDSVEEATQKAGVCPVIDGLTVMNHDSVPICYGVQSTAP